MHTDTQAAPSGGPKTPEGKRIAARNATSHGLFSRDIVLPHLGEDPAGYDALLNTLVEQIRPKNLMDQHYVEKIAAASWRLRRLQRWQAQLFEDPALSEEEALSRLDRVMRHEVTLHRQIDTAVKMLGKCVPDMFEARLRREQLAFAQVTEQDCRKDEEWDWVIANNTREQLAKLSARPASLDAAPARLDNVPSQNGQNELYEHDAPCPLPAQALSPASPDGPGSLDADPAEKCQNELPVAVPALSASGRVAEERGREEGIYVPVMPEAEWEAWEDMINDGLLTREERRQQMLRKDLPPWQKEADGRVAIRDMAQGA